MKRIILTSVSAAALSFATAAWADNNVSNVTQGALTDQAVVVVDQAGPTGSTSN